MTTPTTPHQHSHHQTTASYIDPVCGMSTDNKNGFTPHVHEGETYYFCSDHCLTAFSKDPGAFIKTDATPEPVVEEHPPTGTLYTCPMHPEVEQDALPVGHPFTAMRDGYWSSTTSFFETDWAWVLYLNKGACGVGHKPGKTFYVWPVTTLNTLLRSRGQYIQFSKN